MYKMFMGKQTWNSIIKDKEWVNNTRAYPHVFVPSEDEIHQLLVAPADLHPEIENAPHIEILEPEGLVKLEVLRPIWEWVGHPPVLQLKAVGWRVWEDRQIAFELERQIIEPPWAHIDIDWGESMVASMVARVVHLGMFEADFAAIEKQIFGGLGILKSFLEAPLTPQPVEVDQIDRDIINDIDISIIMSLNTVSRRLFKGKPT